MMQITGGKYNSRIIKTAEFENIKPTLSKTRQGIFNALTSMIEFEGKVFFDMFAGSGIMSLEAVSRGFSAVLFEKDKNTALMIKSAFKSLGLTPELYFGDAVKNLKKIEAQADVIFLDPPYNSDLYERALEVILQENKLKPEGIIIMEHPIDKKINTRNFELIKSKKYGNKQITYLKKLS